MMATTATAQKIGEPVGMSFQARLINVEHAMNVQFLAIAQVNIKAKLGGFRKIQAPPH